MSWTCSLERRTWSSWRPAARQRHLHFAILPPLKSAGARNHSLSQTPLEKKVAAVHQLATCSSSCPRSLATSRRASQSRSDSLSGAVLRFAPNSIPSQRASSRSVIPIVVASASKHSTGQPEGTSKSIAQLLGSRNSARRMFGTVMSSSHLARASAVNASSCKTGTRPALLTTCRAITHRALCRAVLLETCGMTLRLASAHVASAVSPLSTTGSR